MKNLLIFTLLVICSFVGNAQYYLPYYYRHPAAIYVTHQPVDLGIGIRGDYYIHKLGIYNSISYGNWGTYKETNLRHHFKFTIGVLMPLANYNEGKFDIMAGINYHLLKTGVTEYWHADPKMFNPWSFELGLTTKIRHFAVGMRMDILRHEPGIDFGYTF